ncbi:aminotransferase class I/II-fold pyridoxal phosphate-dependent enzyme [Actinoplanes sp. CA-142083]|uniref:aminotransferase class I/II-fold pyridoxal phosphate-dependent enzyme n=1 Tax=Actinoplanes sp. CA-142083 TaxID=3239903 RepID=UPI003D94A018
MSVDPFGKGGLHEAEVVLKAHGVDAFFREAAERTGDSHVVIDGRKVLMAGSHDYLGLSTHPHVVEAAVRAVRRWGTTVSGSRPLSGSLVLHRELEDRLAAFLGQEAATLTNSGFQANLALSSLMGRHDVVFADARNHASLVDAARLGWGRVHRYKNLDQLGKQLADAPSGTGRLILTDGVFSMDGDAADLRGLRALADHHGAKLVVDAAHDMGVLGARGRGLVEHCGLDDRVDLISVTLSKSLASIGAALAGPAAHVNYLRTNARPILYSVAVPPASAAAALAALDVVETEPERRRHVLDLAEGLHNGLRRMGLDTRPSTTPVVPVRFADMATAGAFWAALFEAGVFTNLVGPPASGTAMLRLTLTANHDETHLATVLEACDRAARQLGVPRVPDIPEVALTRSEVA